VAATEPEDLDDLAGEYVLGTLAADERRAAEARLAADPAFRGAVAAWEARLQPFADAVGELPVPAAVRARVLAAAEEGAPATEPGGEAAGNVVALRRSVRRWRIMTGLVGAAAAVLAVVVAVDRLRPVPQTEFVAVLTAGGDAPAFVATVDTAAGTISVRRVADAAPADRSYELWSIAPNEAPRSLGLVEQASFSQPLPVSPAGDGVTLAITLEPKGGSPTGAPTSAPIFSGTLVATEE
jgi:anti-sigma-K factor RskA